MPEARRVITDEIYKALDPEDRLLVRLLCAAGLWQIAEDKKPQGERT